MPAFARCYMYTTSPNTKNKLYGMKKNILFLAAMALVLVCSACNGNNGKVTAEDLDGEWEVSWIYDIDSVVGRTPFVGFETKVDGVFGSTGCNRIMGSYKLVYSEHFDCTILEFNQVATTRMMCEDMATERSVITALNNALFCTLADSVLTLMDKDRVPVLKLVRRPEILSIEGHWEVFAIDGLSNDSINSDSLKAFMDFNTTDMRLNAGAGCNIINSNLLHDDNDDFSLSFSPAMSTMMACKDMRVEQALIGAMNKVAEFKFCSRDTLVLSCSNGNEIIVLTR